MNHSKFKSNIFCCIISFVLLFSVSAAASEKVYVGGMPFGVRFQAGEVSVIRTSSFLSGGEKVSPASEAGIRENDVISQINQKTINTVSDFTEAIDKSSGEIIDLIIKRGDKEIHSNITPKISDETGEYMLGILLKDSSAGIGTVTFIKDGSLVFAGLGHGICDADDKILNISNGYISHVKINGVTKGSCGAPGELRGSLNSEKCGKLLSNTETGVYGIFTDVPSYSREQIEVAKADEVKNGAATILCTLDDNRCCEYEIEITEIDNEKNTKNYVLKITDQRLIEKTGGIVQGMSGSPILQNGKIVGAVTHVFVNDPTRGYGIFIENMLAEAEKISD